MPQVSFLSQQKFCRKTRLLSQQKYACRNKTSVLTKLCLSQPNIFVATNKHMFVATNVLSRQAYFCHDKSKLVATKLYLSGQKCVCHNKSFSATESDIHSKCYSHKSRQRLCLSGIYRHSRWCLTIAFSMWIFSETKTYKRCQWYQKRSLFLHVGERGGEWGKQVGSMNEKSQVRGCYNITFISTNQETVSVLEKTQANKTFRTWKQT